MRTGLFYLNNSLNKWVIYNNGVKEKITLKTDSGKEITRTIIYWKAFGCFALALISYKGKKNTCFSHHNFNVLIQLTNF